MRRSSTAKAETDFRRQPFRFDPGSGPKFWYSIRLLREARKRNLFGASRPAHIPAIEEALEFWRYRDATGLVSDAVHKIPNLGVIVVANTRNHMQLAPDHPHVRIQVNAFETAGARFIRLNPDRAYVEWLVGEPRPGLPDNDAGDRYTPQSIGSAVRPNDVAHRTLLQLAALCELADRVQAGNFKPNLTSVLYPAAPRAVRRPPNRSSTPWR